VLQELNPDVGRTTGVISLTSLVRLTLGAFAIGTEGFMIAGLLPTLARDLNVGLPAAGHLVTAFSLAYAIGAPIMAVLTAGLERRRLLAVAVGGFALGNLVAAVAPDYAGLLVARLLLALARRRDILGVLVTTVLTVAGTFTVYTYLSVFIAGVAGLGPQALAPVSLSMNSSAIYLGSAMGAAAGALVIAGGAIERLGWVAAGFALAALLPVLFGCGSTSAPPCRLAGDWESSSTNRNS
jgi:predicted MFS family arabinose efflux permease